MREVAVVKFNTGLYSVKCRTNRPWWFGGNSDWLSVITVSRTVAWPYAEARQIADQVLNNGFISIHTYSNEVYPIFDLEEE